MISSTRTSLFLMANLGSEMVRLFAAVERHDELRAAQSAARATFIINELESHEELRGRTAEVKVLAAIVEDVRSGAKKLSVSRRQIERYFLPFALKVMQS